MYALIYSPTALKELEKLDEPMRKRIITALERLRIRPEFCNIKQLVGMPGYRFVVGDYRIIFAIKNKRYILVLKIGHCRKIYD